MAAQSQTKLEMDIGPLLITDALWVNYPDGVRRGFFIDPPKLDLEIVMDKEIYNIGDRAFIRAKIVNPLGVQQSYDRLELKLINSLNAEYWRENFNSGNKDVFSDYPVEANSVVNIDKDLVLDRTWLKGKYYIEARIFNRSGKEIGYNVKEFEYYDTYLKMRTILPGVWGKTTFVRFNIENRGKIASGEDGNIEASVPSHIILTKNFKLN